MKNMKRIKNKLQQKIKTIKTVFIRMLCVSLKKDSTTTENNLCEYEKIGKFEKIKKNMKKLFNIGVKRQETSFCELEYIEKANENMIKNWGKPKTHSKTDIEYTIKEMNDAWERVKLKNKNI